MEELQQENLELVRRLAAQEEALGYSNRQLDQRSSDCQALSRQLEAALSDVRLQVRLRGRVVTSGEEVVVGHSQKDASNVSPIISFFPQMFQCLCFSTRYYGSPERQVKTLFW